MNTVFAGTIITVEENAFIHGYYTRAGYGLAKLKNIMHFFYNQ